MDCSQFRLNRSWSDKIVIIENRALLLVPADPKRPDLTQILSYKIKKVKNASTWVSTTWRTLRCFIAWTWYTKQSKEKFVSYMAFTLSKFQCYPICDVYQRDHENNCNCNCTYAKRVLSSSSVKLLNFYRLNDGDLSPSF